MILRPYQEEVLKQIKTSSSKKQLVVLPTGTGKTIVFSELIKRLNKRSLILAHRDELISQAVDKLRLVWQDADIGVIKGKRHEPDHQVTVASVQSLHEKRLAGMPTDYELIVTDEAHHATARTYRRIYDVMCPALHLGFTATPNRTDKRLLGDVYDTVTFESDLLEFIPEYLCDLKIIRRDSGIELDGQMKTTYDLNCNQLSDVLNTPEGNQFAVEAWQEVASDRQSTIAFCADIAHVHGLAQVFKEAGIRAEGIDSNMKLDERRGILEDFFNGDIEVLLNCGILTEGFDCPQVDCVLLVRPTRSELLLRQMIGRGTRLYPDKSDCLILDIACVSKDWDLVTPANLFGMQPEDDGKLVSEASRDGDPRMRSKWDNISLHKQIAGIYDTRNPGKLQWQKIRWKGWCLRLGKDGTLRVLPKTDGLKVLNEYVVEYNDSQGDEMSLFTQKLANDVPLDTAFTIAEAFVRANDLDVSLVLPNRRWHKHLATEKQLNYIKLLDGAKYIMDDMTKKEASDLITFLNDRSEK